MNKYPVILCYHGVTEDQSKTDELVSYMEDIKQQVNLLRDKGYVFVSPSEFNEWYEGRTGGDPPAVIHFDDALESMDPAAKWLIEETIPFGIAVIASRQRKRVPEKGYLSWKQLAAYVKTGRVEILHHTYDFHHYVLNKEDGNAASVPFLESPPWIDDGAEIWAEKTEAPKIYERSLLENSLAFPLFGTDSETSRPIESSITFQSEQTTDVQDLTLFACGHAGEPYEAEIEIQINETSVFNGFFTSDWVENDWTVFSFNEKVKVKEGEETTIRFITNNQGTGTFRAHARLNEVQDSAAFSTDVSADFPAGAPWPVKIIGMLSSGRGSLMSEEMYQQLIRADMKRWTSAVEAYLDADWIEHEGKIEQKHSEKKGIAGTDAAGDMVRTVFSYKAPSDFKAELIQFNWDSPAGAWYPFRMNVFIQASEEKSRFEAASYVPGWIEETEEVPLKPYVFEKEKTYIVTLETTGLPSGNPGFLTFREQGSPFVFMEAKSQKKPLRPDHFCFPFGAYYPQVDETGITVHSVIRDILEKEDIQAGWGVYPERIRPVTEPAEPGLRHDRYALPRFMVYGDGDNASILRQLEVYTGSLSHQKPKRKQTPPRQISIEYDAAGTAELKRHSFAYAAFDTYYFEHDGHIEPGDINEKDKQRAKDNGAAILLVFSNFSFELDEPDGAIAHSVLQHRSAYISQITEICEQGGWDGVTINLEWVYPGDRQVMNEFISELAAVLHKKGRLLHQTVPAVTGTSYDLEEWTGWADYRFLAEQVDALKIMSYTEGVDDEPPQPHAPDGFHQEVYDYVDRWVRKKDREKILVGVNAFGRIWTKQEDGSFQGRYVTTHEAVAEAVLHKAYIEEYKDGECFWETEEAACYFSSPLTIERAEQTAVSRGYGGIGVWKADDGDVLDYEGRKSPAEKKKKPFYKKWLPW